MPTFDDIRPMPRSDPAFGRAARAIAARATSPAAVQSELRSLYPHAVVRERGLASEPRVLYIYRDGYFRGDDDDRWWEREPVATAHIDLETGLISHSSTEFAALLGDGVGAVAGRPFMDFLLPEARAAAAEIIETLRQEGEVVSHMLLRRLDGSLARYEFRATLEGGRIDISYRPRPAADDRRLP